MKKTLFALPLIFLTLFTKAQGDKYANISFPTEWLKYEFYEHQLFFSNQTLAYFKQELDKDNSACFVKMYNPKGKVHTWIKVETYNSEGFPYTVAEKPKLLHFEDVVDWKISKQGVEYGYFTKSQIISLKSTDDSYNTLLHEVMNDFYEWKYLQGIRGIRVINQNNTKQDFALVYDIESYDSLTSRNLEVKTDVDYNPQFPGGIYWMHKYINQKIDLKKLSDYGYESIFTRFTIGTDGTVKNVAIVKGEINLDMDKMVAKMVYDMPKWIPAVKDNKPVEATCYLPIYFD